MKIRNLDPSLCSGHRSRIARRILFLCSADRVVPLVAGWSGNGTYTDWAVWKTYLHVNSDVHLSDTDTTKSSGMSGSITPDVHTFLLRQSTLSGMPPLGTFTAQTGRG